MHFHRPLRAVLVLLGTLAVAGCASRALTPTLEDTVAKATGETGLSQPAKPIAIGTDARVSGPATDYTGSIPPLVQTEYFIGDEGGRGSEPKRTRVASSTDEGDITLNFVDAPIADVVDVIVGDILEENYSISPQVTGTVTTRTSSPLPRVDLLPILENLLALKGASLKKSNGIYYVLPFEEGSRLPNVVVSPDRSINSDGIGVHVIPLRHVPVDSVLNVVSGQVTPGRQLVGDNERNILLFIGPPQEARAIEDMVSVLDIDALNDKLFALIPAKAAPIDQIIKNLEDVFEGSAKESLRFFAISRLNAVLVIAKDSRTLTKVQSWVERFDRANIRAERQVFVYYVRNGRASELASILDQLFSDGGATGASVAPGLEAVEVSTGGDVEAVVASSDRSSSGPKIIADERNNALIIMGTAAEYDKIEAILWSIDIVPLQVLIEVIVAEVSLTGDLEHGVEWYFKTGDLTSTFSTLASGQVQNTFPGFGLSFETANAKVVLNALETVTDVNVVSSPKLMVLDNQSARLQVGDQVPVATRSAVATDNPDSPIVNSVEMVDTGVILEVTPTVNTGGLVSLNVIQEVSEAQTTRTSDIDSPTIQTRKISSTLAVQSGETVALAGLMRDRRETSETGVPVLRRMPVLGNLFKRKGKRNARTELIVLITPRVVRDPGEMRQVTNELRSRLSER